MYNKKQILLLFGGALIILVCLIILIVTHSKSSSGAKIMIQTQNGNVSVNNYTKSSVQELPSTTVIVDNKSYTIDNQHGSNPAGSTNSFHIFIEAGPVAQVRQQAEQEFLKVLGISQADACKLQVYLQVANSVDSNLSGTNWGLSFCSNGIQFPAGQ